MKLIDVRLIGVKLKLRAISFTKNFLKKSLKYLLELVNKIIRQRICI